MDELSSAGALTVPSAAEAPAPLPENAQSGGGHDDDIPKRRQYQNCDYCRKRRRACNAVRLGINPFAQESASEKKLACTNCQRANKVCTFNWLLDLPKGLPQSVKLQLAALDHKALERRSSIRRVNGARVTPSVRAGKQRNGTKVHNVMPKRSSMPNVPTIPISPGTRLSSGFSFDGIYQELPSQSNKHSTTYASTWHGSIKSFTSYEVGVTTSGSEATQFHTQTLWTTTSPMYERPLAIHSTQFVNDTAAMPATSNEITWPSIIEEEEEEDQSADASSSLIQDSTQKPESSSSRLGRESRSYHDDSSETPRPDRNNVDDFQHLAVINSRSSNDKAIVSESKIAETSIRTFFLAGLKQIYHNSMENSLMSWLSVGNTPYERRVAMVRRNSPFPDQTCSLSASLFERAHYLDNALSPFRTKPLTPAQNAAASEVLNLAVLSFASQWSSSGEASSQRNKASDASVGGDFDSQFFSESFDFEYMIRQSLWTRLNACLDRLSGCDAFRVIAARLILFFVTRPPNREERELIEYLLRVELLPSSVQVASESADLDDVSVESDGAPRRTKPAKSKDTRTLLDLLGAESRTDHLQSAMHHLASWSARIKELLRITAPKFNQALPNQFRQHILQTCPHFNTIFWFAVMLDTARSALYRRALIFFDEETEFQIIKHESDEPDSSEIVSNVDESLDGIVFNTRAGELKRSEIWMPLTVKATSLRDNPFTSRQQGNFLDRVVAVIQETIPLIILINRKVSLLQAAIIANLTEDDIEGCVAEILSACNNWEIQFRQFYNHCMAQHSDLPFRVRSWYLMGMGHWLVGMLRGLELIDEYDLQSNSGSIQRALRLSTCLILRLKKDYSYVFAQLTKTLSLDRSGNTVDQTNQEFHSAIRPGSLLADPCPDVMVFGMKSSCDIMLSWLRVLREPPIPSDVRNVWVQCNVVVEDLVRRCLSIIDSMAQLGNVSAFADINAKIYYELFDSLRNK